MLIKKRPYSLTIMRSAITNLVLASLPLICICVGYATAQTKPPTLEQRIQWLESRVNALEYQRSKDDSVELDTSNPHAGFQKLNSNNGVFLVSLKSIERYLNGYKVVVEFGNPSTATFEGFELETVWNKREPDGTNFDNWRSWYERRKHKKFTYSSSLLPGRWNEVEIFIVPAAVDELGYLGISIETNTVVLTAK